MKYRKEAPKYAEKGDFSLFYRLVLPEILHLKFELGLSPEEAETIESQILLNNVEESQQKLQNHIDYLKKVVETEYSLSEETRNEPQINDLPIPGFESDVVTVDENNEKGALLNQGMNFCYVHAEMDEQVIINRVTTVEVTLSSELLKSTESMTSITNLAKIDYNKLLLLQVIPKTNFTVVGENRLEIPPPTVDNSHLHYYFDLRATNIGKGEVWIVVRQGQVPLSTIKLKPEIIHSRAEIRGVQKTNNNSYLNLNSNLNEPPNQLTIIERRNGQEIRYDYEFRSMSLNILNRYESKPITSERYEYVENLYKEIENRWLSTQDDVDLFSDELRAFGGQLFDRLFPEELQQTLWEHHSTINSIMVISTEPFIPWELVHLKQPGQKILPDETKFLGQMGLVRWLYDAGWPPESIQIRNQRIYCIIPQYPITKYQLPQAQQECKLLVEKFQAVLVEPQPKPVLDLIKAGKFDLIHFAGHGVVDPKNMTSSKLMLEGRLEGNQYIKNYLNSTLVEQFLHLEQDENHRPIVVLNACQVGQSSYALTGMSGFAQAFLKGGAGAFVAPLWSVGDRPARIFIETLYRELINGLNLSEATSLARNTAKQTGDASWLAYSVYGHPHLKLVFPPSQVFIQVFEFDVVTLDEKGQEVKQQKVQAQYFTEDLGNVVTLDMVYIPSGSFLMGTKDEEIERLVRNYNRNGFIREKPQHEVTIQPFFMGKYPVTQAQWRAIASREDLRVEYDLELEPSKFIGDDLPVERVSWSDAVEFCQRLSKQTGKEYRLPSEAEWEYACRAETTTPFNFGETITGELANYRASENYASEPKGEYRRQTTPVGNFPPNAFGLYDMHGQVLEWCQDDWHGNYEGAPTNGSAWLSGASSIKVVRSGSCLLDPSRCRSAARIDNNCVVQSRDIGLRVVCVMPRTT